MVGFVREYDPSSGAGAKLSDLKGAPANPQNAVSSGVIYIYDRKNYSMESADLNAGAAGVIARQYYEGTVNEDHTFVALWEQIL